ncbi:MAG: ABC transporter ATP-binding protein [Thermoplasmatota archaeon]
MYEDERPNDYLLRIDDLTLWFSTYVGDVQALEHLNLDIRRNETLGLVGESGCGKSVTAMSILRLLASPPANYRSGRILLRNKTGPDTDILALPLSELQSIRGKDVSMIFQEPMTSLNPVMRVGRQIAEVILRHEDLGLGPVTTLERALEVRGYRISRKLRERNRRANAIAVDMIKKIGIPDPQDVALRYPHELSGGMRQRIMIAMALATKPHLLIADEPTTALDVTIQAQIMHLMRDVKKDANASILLITHHLGIVAEMCDRIAVMYAGTIAESGPSHEIFYAPAHPYTIGLLKSIPSLSEGGTLPVIPGSVPDLLYPPTGCRFHTRCPYVMPECKVKQPPLYKVGPEHYVSCVLYDGRHTVPEELQNAGIGKAMAVPVQVGVTADAARAAAKKGNVVGEAGGTTVRPSSAASGAPARPKPPGKDAPPKKGGT